MSDNKSLLRIFALLILVASLSTAWVAVSRRSENALVVYCAHDLVFAEQILDDFEQQTGIDVIIVGDSEATKSLGLVQRLIREKQNPKCDVFWNNQVLGTIDLAEQGILKPYQGSGYSRLPDKFKDPQGLWTGFAGRLRVWIVNTDAMPADLDEIETRFRSEDLSRMAIAMPMYGTTLSHFSMLWQTMGAEPLQEWFKNLSARDCRIVPGNSTVKNLVAEGVCDFGWTDTDDFFVGKDAGHSVAMVPIRINNQTICLPNSVAMIKGTKREQQAALLIDYLLSEEVEIALAHSGSRQIPLGPVAEQKLPADVNPLLNYAREAADVTQFSDARKQCLHWLQTEYLESN